MSPLFDSHSSVRPLGIYVFYKETHAQDIDNVLPRYHVLACYLDTPKSREPALPLALIRDDHLRMTYKEWKLCLVIESPEGCMVKVLYSFKFGLHGGGIVPWLGIVVPHRDISNYS
jgi:hypothetical protein